MESKRLRNEVTAGLTSGLLTTVVTHPLDLVKLRLQLLATSNPSQGYDYIIRGILKDSTGIKSLIPELYRGLGVNILGNATAWGLYFGLYRYSKDAVFSIWTGHRRNEISSNFEVDRQMGPFLYLFSATLSGLTTAVLTNPIWVVKTRIMSTNARAEQSYRSTWDGIRQLYTSEGLSGFWRGLGPSLLGVAQGALYFTLYDSLKKHYFAATGVKRDTQLSNFENIFMTSISKMISVSAVYPFQLLKSNLQSFEAQLHQNSFQATTLVKSIYAAKGLKGLYKGLSANLIRAVPSTCITFCVYENMRHWL
ncbi:LAMI_0C08592g1_1 [Lachancea mirantina]|uniref:LAMI_0C08592g1_1 n=1 Tax=Lachancea mirantina TaxID=1230905 RepID=A0A1G4J4Q7_9SACH|nr:LAMI_0C08592g1_1 [Lachancea mirantina]